MGRVADKSRPGDRLPYLNRSAIARSIKAAEISDEVTSAIITHADAFLSSSTGCAAGFADVGRSGKANRSAKSIVKALLSSIDR